MIQKGEFVSMRLQEKNSISTLRRKQNNECSHYLMRVALTASNHITFIMNCSHNLPWYKRENLYLWDCRKKTPYHHLGGNKTMSAVITSCMLLRRPQTISPSSWIVVTICHDYYYPMTSVSNSAQNFYTNISIQHEKDSVSLDILLVSR
jgi:hypothetical protein